MVVACDVDENAETNLFFAIQVCILKEPFSFERACSLFDFLIGGGGDVVSS